jgi:hypothetical protein
VIPLGCALLSINLPGQKSDMYEDEIPLLLRPSGLSHIIGAGTPVLVARYEMLTFRSPSKCLALAKPVTLTYIKQILTILFI